MTDLTNRSAKESNEYIQIYAPLLEISRLETFPDAHLLAIIFDIAIKYIKEKYNTSIIDWKIWAVFVARDRFYNNKIKTEEDVKNSIDDFHMYWITEYKNYCNNIIACSKFDGDRDFVYQYLHNKKIGKITDFHL